MRAILRFSLLALTFMGLSVPAAAADTRSENLKLGDPGWENGYPLTQERWGETVTSEAIEAYPSQPSVVAGASLGFHVRTKPVAPYRVEIHRLGWYGGSGGRRVACFPTDCTTTLPGGIQPEPPAPDTTGLVDAGWSENLVVPTNASWVSGYHLAEFILGTGARTRVPFIVRSADPAPDAILVMAATNTWQAYNFWGGKSLYPRGADPRPAHRVSYQRPYSRVVPALFRYEYQFVRYLEREIAAGRIDGPVEYTTNIDVHRNPGSVAARPLAISLGHDEYWSMRIRDAFEQARDGGTNLIFMGSNMAYWHVRTEDAERTIVAYKDDSRLDPGTPPTRRFRQLGRPECALLGVQFMGGFSATGAETSRAYTVDSSSLSHPWMIGTGFEPGDQLPKAVGYEWDAKVDGCSPPGLTTFFAHSGPPEGDPNIDGDPSTNAETGVAHAVGYTAASGAEVFSTGSMQFVFALDDYAGVDTPASPKAQAFVRNVLRDLSSFDGAPTDGDIDGAGGDTPSAAAPVASPTPAPTPVADRRAPALKLQPGSLSRLAAERRVAFYATCDERCSLSARGRFAGVRLGNLRSATVTGPPGRRVKLSLSASASQRRAIRRAVARRRLVTLTVVVAGRDASGNVGSAVIKVRWR